MDFAVVGLGAVGARAARQLASTPGVDRLVLIDLDNARAVAAAKALGGLAEPVDWKIDEPLPEQVVTCDAVLLVGPTETHLGHARALLAAGVHVVSTSDSRIEVEALLELDAQARANNAVLLLGAAFSPGMAGVLASHAAGWLDVVDEVHVARIGTGGPACAVQHHRSFGGHAMEWRDGEWRVSPSGSGRELCWFPDPLGAADCYRGDLAEPALLAAAFPEAQRISARLAGTRRDRLTARLPMLRKPHPEGEVGGIRVELRGWRNSSSETVVVGAMERPAVAAGAVAALSAVEAVTGRVRRVGAGGLAELVEPVPFLSELARRGVKAAVFEGSDSLE